MNDGEKIDRKQALKAKAIEILTNRITLAEKLMSEAQQAANSEDKSSAGDKYETARAMALIDRDIYARQLESSRKDLAYVSSIDVSMLQRKIEPGSYAETSAGNYFFLTGLGSVDVDGSNVFFLSIASPLGKAFHNKVQGESASFNGKEINIIEAF